MPYRPPGLIALIYRQLEIEDDNREDERLCDLCTPAGNLEPYLRHPYFHRATFLKVANTDKCQTHVRMDPFYCLMSVVEMGPYFDCEVTTRIEVDS